MPTMRMLIVFRSKTEERLGMAMGSSLCWINRFDFWANIRTYKGDRLTISAQDELKKLCAYRHSNSRTQSGSHIVKSKTFVFYSKFS